MATSFSIRSASLPRFSKQGKHNQTPSCGKSSLYFSARFLKLLTLSVACFVSSFSPVEFVELAAWLAALSEVRTGGAVEAASCFLNFVAAEAPKYSCVPAAFCLAASVSNSVDVARSPIPLF